MQIDWTDVAQYVRGAPPSPREALPPTTTLASSTAVDEANAPRAMHVAHAYALERRRATVRTCICAMLGAIATIAVVVLLSAVFMRMTAPAQLLHAMLDHVQQAAAVQFTLEVSPAAASELDDAAARTHPRRYRHKHTASLLEASVARVTGSLLPRTSEDSGQMRFDGWLQIETTATPPERHDVVLANHRGYRTVRALPSLAVVHEECLTIRDIPPLHTLSAVPPSGFYIGDTSALHSAVNCSTFSRPIELLFMDMPFVVCATDDLLTAAAAAHASAPMLFGAAYSATAMNVISARTSDSGGAASHSQQVVVYGERVTIHANVTARKHTAALESVASAAEWRRQAARVPTTCMYLEAPLTSGRAKQSFLYQVLPPR